MKSFALLFPLSNSKKVIESRVLTYSNVGIAGLFHQNCNYGCFLTNIQCGLKLKPQLNAAVCLKLIQQLN